jgi:hypothetical protein
MTIKSGLVVLEGKWSRSSNLSVKSLFDVLVDINFLSTHDYYFEQFANRSALEAILGTVGKHFGGNYLYIGSHGDETGFSGSSGHISRTAFRNILKGKLGPSYRGIFLGSCLFGSIENAKFLFGALPSNIKWICGYNESVDWVESSVLDMLFWNQLFNWNQTRDKFSDEEIITSVCEIMHSHAPGLIGKLSFQVFLRPSGRGKNPKKLIPEDYFYAVEK